MADMFTEIANHTTTVTNTFSFTRYDHPIPSSPLIPTNVTVGDDVKIIVVVEVPLTCKNLHDYYHGRWTENILSGKNMIGDLKPNPDIAGIGVC